MIDLSSMEALRAACTDFADGDAAAADAARARQAELVKPEGSLGRLEDIAVHMARWQRTPRPRLADARIIVFAGSHGVTRNGVSPFPDEVNAQMLGGFRAGFAAICQLAEAFGARLEAIDCGVGEPTGDLASEPAMTEEGFLEAVRKGVDAVGGIEDILIFGDMGIGNTTAAAAVAAALFGGTGADWAGRGAGLDETGLARKAAVVDRSLAFHGDALGDPLEALRRVGGREMAAIMGACLAARRHGVPVLLDGYIVCASVAPLRMLDPAGLDHAMAAHCSAEPGHRRVLERLELDPLLGLGMRLGEGSGAATALGLVRAALACHNGMATFAEAAVAGRKAEA